MCFTPNWNDVFTIQGIGQTRKEAYDRITTIEKDIEFDLADFEWVGDEKETKHLFHKLIVIKRRYVLKSQAIFYRIYEDGSRSMIV